MFFVIECHSRHRVFEVQKTWSLSNYSSYLLLAISALVHQSSSLVIKSLYPSLR